MIKAVVFDLDDTLISERQYILSGFNVVSNELSNMYKLDRQEVYEKMISLFEESSKNVFNRILEHFNIKYSKDEIVNFINIYRNHKPNIEFFDDVIPTILDLRKRGIKTGIITDGYKETQRIKVEVLGCKELFDEIIITDELGREFWKPHERAYKMMAENLNVEFKEMIYVGDNITKDFITANLLGIKTIYIKRKLGVYKDVKYEEKYKATNEIKSTSEIKYYI